MASLPNEKKRRGKIFLSYRRTHAEVLKPCARNLQAMFESAYFLDDRFHRGLNVDRSTNRETLEECDVVLVLISQQPSGPSEHWSSNLSSMEMMKRCDDLGGGSTADENLNDDYCLDELRYALKLGKIVVPVYAPHLSVEQVQKEFTHIHGVRGLSKLANTKVESDAFRLTSDLTKLTEYIVTRMDKKLAKQHDNRQDGSTKGLGQKKKKKKSPKRLRKSQSNQLLRAGSTGNVLAGMQSQRKRRQSFQGFQQELSNIGMEVHNDYDSESSDDNNVLRTQSASVVGATTATTTTATTPASVGAKSEDINFVVESKSKDDPSSDSDSSNPVQTTPSLQLRSRSSSSSGCGGVLNKPGKWNVFISYTQHSRSAEMLAVNLFFSCKERNLSCWLDSKMGKKSKDAMEEGVKNCDLFIPIISGPGPDDKHPKCPEEKNAYFARDYCQLECQWALDSGKMIQPVCVYSDKTNIGEFFSNAPLNLQQLGERECISLDNTEAEVWEVQLNKVFAQHNSAKSQKGCCEVQ